MTAHANSHKIVIVGGVPKPIGGVTAFIHRLINYCPGSFKAVWDLYPSRDKVKTPVEFIQITHGVLGLIWRCAFSHQQIILFNFSGARSLLALAFIPKRSNRWGLILHNGELAAGRLSPYARMAMKAGLRKIDVLGVLSHRQCEFYASMDYPMAKQCNVKSYIPLIRPSQETVAERSPSDLLAWKQEGKRIFIISGYPTKIYQHLEVIKIFKEIADSVDPCVRLGIFLYGDDSDGILDDIKNQVLNSFFAKLYWDASEEVFCSALSLASGYIRMNTVDSFGIAVADAISFSIPVIATDVCERQRGAFIVAPNDFSALKIFILHTTNYSVKEVGAFPEDGLSNFLESLQDSQRVLS